MPGDALDNPEQDEEDRQLHQERQTPTQRIDAVLLVERHQLLVHLLAIVLVPRLNRFEFGLQSLHLQHRARALERQWGNDDHHSQREQDDCNAVGRDQRVEEGEDLGDQIEHEGSWAGGTGS